MFSLKILIKIEETTMFKPILKPIMALMVCALFFTGCASTHNQLRTDQYAKELVPHHRSAFSRVRTVAEDGELKVSGALRLKGMMRVDIPDYVEVALIDQSGAVIAAQKTAYYPRTLTGRKCRREGRFSVRFPEMPPEGTTVRVSNVN